MTDQPDSKRTTESLERRGREVQENGVVEGKDWNAIVVGLCGGIFIVVTALVNYL